MDYGFLGIFDRHDDPGAVWTLASDAIAKETGYQTKCIRTFLESLQGRYFAQAVSKLMSENIALETAVDTAVARWMRLKIRPEDESVCRRSVPEGFCLPLRAKGGHWRRLAAPHQPFCLAVSAVAPCRAYA